ncbi:hypothetical protein HYU09_01505 [Candidatus Woesearchaeota archaeon]|nr:hypothetical protein [Candidatus Woesearchaeota archaeon]
MQNLVTSFELVKYELGTPGRSKDTRKAAIRVLESQVAMMIRDYRNINIADELNNIRRGLNLIVKDMAKTNFANTSKNVIKLLAIIEREIRKAASKMKK